MGSKLPVFISINLNKCSFRSSYFRTNSHLCLINNKYNHYSYLNTGYRSFSTSGYFDLNKLQRLASQNLMLEFNQVNDSSNSTFTILLDY